MNEMYIPKKEKTCPSCGAPLVSEICPYCGVATGLNSATADMEYPVLECKEANLNFWNIVFPLIFAVSFGGVGLVVIPLAIIFEYTMLFIGIPFFLIGSISLCFVIRSLSRYIKVKKNGKITQATVYGYLDDNVLINSRPAQIVKLLVQTSNGPRFILYSLGSTVKPYGINDNIDVIVYLNYFLITKKKEVVKW